VQLTLLERNLAGVGLRIEDICSAIAEIGQPQWPVFVHGSVLTENFDSESDIDIICCGGFSACDHVITFYSGVRLDIKFYNWKYLTRELENDIYRGQDGLCQALAQGLPIKGEWKILVEYAKQSLKATPIFPKERIQNYLAGVFSDLRKPLTRLERIGVAGDLMRTLCEAKLLASAEWSAQGRVLYARACQHDAALAQQLEVALSDFIDTGDFDPLKKIAAAILGTGSVQFVAMKYSRLSA
jgi:hypothetical protein